MPKSRGLASRDSHASHRSRAVDTGCLEWGLRSPDVWSRVPALAARWWRRASVFPSVQWGSCGFHRARRCARVPGWHVGASPIVSRATGCIVVTTSPTGSPPPLPGVAGYNEHPCRGNPPGPEAARHLLRSENSELGWEGLAGKAPNPSRQAVVGAPGAGCGNPHRKIHAGS